MQKLFFNQILNIKTLRINLCLFLNSHGFNLISKTFIESFFSGISPTRNTWFHRHVAFSELKANSIVLDNLKLVSNTALTINRIKSQRHIGNFASFRRNFNRVYHRTIAEQLDK